MTTDERFAPLLIVRAAAEAIDFYVRAFGATEVVRYLNNVNGTISHADLTLAGSLGGQRFSVTEEARGWNSDAPPSLGGSPVVLQLRVADVEATLERVCAAGAAIVFPLGEFSGERMARVRDPFGHLWIVSQRVEHLTPEENQRRRDALFAAFASSSDGGAGAGAPGESLARTQRAHRESRTEGSVSIGSSRVPPSADPRLPPTRVSSRAMAFESAATLSRKIRTKEISSLELTRYFIDRIERFDRKVHAIAVRDFDRAIDAAKQADEDLAHGHVRGPLHGLPMTLKEAYDVAGLETTWGVVRQRRHVASEDSDVAARFRAAGAHFLGKTNVPVMLGDFQTSNDIFGTTNNPWDTTRVPGGSSGGSAAALAAGLTALEAGSDVGGLIRNPAHYCGVFGHKPTFGIVSMRGHELPSIPPAPDMAVAGPLARSSEDLALALDALVGPTMHSSGWRLELPAARRTSLRGLRVAVWSSDVIAPVDDEIAARVQHAADAVARAGAIVSDRVRPEFDAAAYRSTYAQLVSAVMGAAASDEVYEAQKKRAGGLDPSDRSKLAVAARALVLDHRAWIRHDMERRRLSKMWATFFETWDILLCPIMATTAFPHDHRPIMERTVTVNGEAQPYFDQVYWASLATLAYLPATVFPCGRSKGGLPIGLQAIGDAFADRTTIAFARELEAIEEIGGFVPPPGFEDGPTPLHSPEASGSVEA